MAHLLSTRISLRWLPDAPSEPTDTLVFNVGVYFMDLRVLRADQSIDWGMAGERQILSTDPLKCRWIKKIDSLGPSDPDEGTFSPLPNGDSLEIGSMPYPERNNEVTEYEEVWRTLIPRPGPGPRCAWILESVDGKTFLGRVGGQYIALCEGEKGFGARSEEWSEEQGWSIKYSIGDVGELISPASFNEKEFEGEQSWGVGDKLKVFDKTYVVRRVETI